MIGLGRMGTNMLRRLPGLSRILGRVAGPSWLRLRRAFPQRFSASLYSRFRSRQDHSFAEKVLSAMRYQFEGHVERPACSRAIRRDNSLKDSSWVAGYDRICFFHMLHDQADS